MSKRMVWEPLRKGKVLWYNTGVNRIVDRGATSIALGLATTFQGGSYMSDNTSNAPTVKTCSKCGETKPLSDFYMIQSGRRAGRYHAGCRACQSIRDAKYRASNVERVRETDRRYYAKNKELVKSKMRAWANQNKDKKRRAMANYAAAHPDRRLAHGAVSDAVRRGYLPPAWSMVCDGCNEAQAAHWHHHNGYSKAHHLDVIAVCITCHVEFHKIYDTPEIVTPQDCRAKLTLEQVEEIRMRARAGEQKSSIARSYGVAHNTVGDIVHLRTWRNHE